MDELLVITVSTLPPDAPGTGTFAEYLQQLTESGIEYHTEIIPSIPNIAAGGNLEFKVETYRRLATQFMHYEKIVISDAFDVRFIGDKQAVLAKIPDNYILCAAEKNCYPEAFLTDRIPAAPGQNSFFNGGLAAGTPQVFLAWCDEIERHPEYDPLTLDQAFFNRRLADQTMSIHIDSQTNLFFSMFLAWDDLDFVGGFPLNLATGGRPSFIHCNNHSDQAQIWERRARSLEEETA